MFMLHAFVVIITSYDMNARQRRALKRSEDRAKLFAYAKNANVYTHNHLSSVRVAWIALPDNVRIPNSVRPDGHGARVRAHDLRVKHLTSINDRKPKVILLA